jgi:D-alanyl-D-alanine carboxypeptidase
MPSRIPTGVLTGLAVATITTSGAVAQAGGVQLRSPANLSRTLDSVALVEMRRFRLPGLSLAVARTSGEILYRGNFGDADFSLRAPVTADTRFRIYSISKVYAATIAHRLAADGALDLDTPVGRYLSDLPPWRDTITVRQLLSHTSGIEDYADVEGYEQAVHAGTANEDAFVTRALQSPLHFSPGTRWRYTNTGYFLLQRVIERVTGLPYAETLAREILVPARLTTTATHCQSSELATGYTPAWGAGLKGDSLVVDPARNDYTFAPAVGGLCATTLDLVHFFQALLSGGLVDSASVQDMVRPALPGIGRSGAGLFASHDDEGFIISHAGGSRNGQSEVMVFVRDSLILAALTNSGEAELEQLLRMLRRRTLDIADPVIDDLPISLEEIEGVVGLYTTVDGPGRTIVVARHDSLFAFGGRLRKQRDGSFVPDYSTDMRVVFRYQGRNATEIDLLRYGVVGGTWRRP